MTEATQPTNDPTRETSRVNLEIGITHGENLPLTSEGIADAVAQYLARILDLGPGNIVITDGRNHISGSVRVFLRSAAITRWK